MTSAPNSKTNKPISQDSLAHTFIDKDGGTLRYDHTVGRWFRWNGFCWEKDQMGKTLHDLRRHVDQGAATENGAMRTASFILSAEKFSRNDPRVAVTHEVWNPDRLLLGTPKGTIDLRDGSSRIPEPSDMITKTTAVSPAETASCPLFLKFLNEATCENQELIDYLQRLCGYALTGETREHVLCFVYGPGGNGKSVFINTLKGVAGMYADVAAMETFTATKFDPHPTILAKLMGSRVVVASETEEGRDWRTSLIKSLTGGDTISARFMRQDYFEFLPQFTLIIVGNHAPKLKNVDDAMKRRLLIIPFNQKPTSIDQKLEEKLQLEWPGILRWMIDGAVLWQRDGLNPPAVVVDATQEYFKQEDVFGQWLEEACEVGSECFVPVTDAFQSWKAYADQRDHDPGNERAFSPKMQQLGFKKKTRSIDGKPTKVWLGITLNAG